MDPPPTKPTPFLVESDRLKQHLESELKEPTYPTLLSKHSKKAKKARKRNFINKTIKYGQYTDDNINAALKTVWSLHEDNKPINKKQIADDNNIPYTTLVYWIKQGYASAEIPRTGNPGSLLPFVESAFIGNINQRNYGSSCFNRYENPR